ncbi:hypothetical protein C2E23DRAFT_692139, partial [Lenzites betulinus]
RSTKEGDMKGWKEGVEEYQALPISKLTRALGLTNSNLPFFNEKQDAIGELDAWSEEGLAALRVETAVPLGPRWHQWVGIVKIMDNLFDKKNILIMDDVGVGKTLQAVGAIAMYEYQRLHYKTHGKYTERFGECYVYWTITSADPDRSCPPGLVDNTLFSPNRRFALIVIDEAHYARTQNKFRIGCVELASLGRMTIAMTATP